MMEHNHPKISINDEGIVSETLHQSQSGTVDMSVNHYVGFQWPRYSWPCCLGLNHEQTMEIEIKGQKIINKLK